MSVEVCPICDIAGCRHIRERAESHIDWKARAEKAEADLREARMQMLSDAGQAAEAYEAQLRAEAQCNAVMKDRAQIMRDRDAALARAERGMKACDLFDGPVSKSQFVNGQATAAQQIRAALAGDAP